MEAILTHHGTKRIKERVGGNKQSADRIAQKALDEGVKHSEVSHGKVKSFMDGLYLSHKKANNMRLYNRKVYLFVDEVLITVINVPTKLCEASDKICKRNKASKSL